MNYIIEYFRTFITLIPISYKNFEFFSKKTTKKHYYTFQEYNIPFMELNSISHIESSTRNLPNTTVSNVSRIA